jgi:hypothetical protein
MPYIPDPHFSGLYIVLQWTEWGQARARTDQESEICGEEDHIAQGHGTKSQAMQ